MTIPTAAANVGVGLDTLAPLRHPALHPGAVLARTPTCAADLRAELRATGTPDLVDTCDLVTSPYPTRFGLWRASWSPAPFLSITNRMLIVRWAEPGGRRRTLLWEPSDVDLGTNTPYFAALVQRTPDLLTERSIADPSPRDSRFPQFFPFSELIADAVATASPDVRPAMVAADRSFRESIARSIQRGVTAGEFPRGVHPAGLATVIVGMLRGVTFQSMIDDQVDLEASRTEIEQLLVERLRPVHEVG